MPLHTAGIHPTCCLELLQAIAQFEERIGRRNEESSTAKLSSMASPTEEVTRLSYIF